MTTFSDVLTALLGCVREEYTVDGKMPGGEVVVAQPGQAMVADWCDGCAGGCGMLYVRNDGMVPSAKFPDPDRTVTSTTSPIATAWHVGVIRGLHGMDAQGNPPAPADQIEDTVVLLEDASKLLTAIRCCLKESLNPRGTVIGPWTPTGPSGDCAGGFWTVTVRVL